LAVDDRREIDPVTWHEAGRSVERSPGDPDGDRLYGDDPARTGVTLATPMIASMTETRTRARLQDDREEASILLPAASSKDHGRERTRVERP
jgi:hypothetical protein